MTEQIIFWLWMVLGIFTMCSRRKITKVDWLLPWLMTMLLLGGRVYG